MNEEAVVIKRLEGKLKLLVKYKMAKEQIAMYEWANNIMILSYTQSRSSHSLSLMNI